MGIKRTNKTDNKNLIATPFKLNSGIDLAYKYKLGGACLSIIGMGLFLSDVSPAMADGPIVSISAVTNTTASSVTLNASVDPNGISAPSAFEYGTTTNYGQTAIATPRIVGIGAGPTAILADVSKLLCNTTYHFRASGQYNHTADSTFTTGACVAPGAPTLVVATAGNNRAIVSFSPPASDGGAPISGYTVTANPSAGTTDEDAGSSSTTHTISGLTNGTSYTFTVRANNGSTGVASVVSNSVTPIASSLGVSSARIAAFSLNGSNIPTLATVEVAMTHSGLAASDFTITNNNTPAAVVSVDSAVFANGKYTLTVSGMNVTDSYSLVISATSYDSYTHSSLTYGTLVTADELDIDNEPNIFSSFSRSLAAPGVVSISNSTYAANARISSGTAYDAIDGNNGNPDNGTATRLVGIFGRAPEGAKCVKTLRLDGTMLQVNNDSLIDANPNYMEIVQGGKDAYLASTSSTHYWETLYFLPMYVQIASARQGDNSRIMVDPADRFRIIEWYDSVDGSGHCTGTPSKIQRLTVKVEYSGATLLESSAAKPVITQPQDRTVYIPASADLSATATVSSGTLSYQWYSNTTNSNRGGTIINGATNSTYSAANASAGTVYYYCEVTNTDGGNQTTVVSNVARVTASVEVAPPSAPVNPFNPAGTTTVNEVNVTLPDGGTFTPATSALVTNLANLENKVGVSDNGVVVITTTPREPVRISSSAPDNVLFSFPTTQPVDVQIGGKGINLVTNTDPVTDGSGKAITTVLATKTLSNADGQSVQGVQVVKGQVEVKSSESNQIVGGLTLSKDVTLRNVTATAGVIGSTVGFYKNPTDFSGAVSAESGDAIVYVKLAPTAASDKGGNFSAEAVTQTRTLTLKAGEVARFDKMGELIGVFAGSLSGTLGKTGDALPLPLPTGVLTYPKAIAKLGGNVLDRLGNNLMPAFLAAVTPPSSGTHSNPGNTFALAQDAATGVVKFTAYGRDYFGLPLMPVPVDGSIADGTVAQSDGTVVWTKNGVSVRFAPAIADLTNFVAAAAGVGVNTQVLDDGTIKLGKSGTVFYARPRFASDAWGGSAGFAINPSYATTSYIGVDGKPYDYGSLINRATFTGADGKTQIFDPAVYDASQINTLLQQVGSGWRQIRNDDGSLSISGPNGQSFKLLPDYAVQIDTAGHGSTQLPTVWLDESGRIVVRYNTGFIPMTQHFSLQ